MSLWRKEFENKFNKLGLKWELYPSSYEGEQAYFILCIDCGNPAIGNGHNEECPYCKECSKKFIKETPYVIENTNTYYKEVSVVKDAGHYVVVRYAHNESASEEKKKCYFNSRGRSVKIKGRKYYI